MNYIASIYFRKILCPHVLSSPNATPFFHLYVKGKRALHLSIERLFTILIKKFIKNMKF